MQNQNQHLEQRKTLGSVAGQKIVSAFEKTSLGKIVIFIAVGYAVLSPESAAGLATATLKANEYFLIKMAAAWFILWHFFPIWDFAKKLFRKIRAKIFSEKTNESIEGVPIHEILHQLFYEGNFKRTEILKKWAIPHARFDTIAKKLESLGILIRGENNARILNSEFSRKQVAEILNSAGGKLKGIKGVLRIFQNGEKLTADAADLKHGVQVAIDSEPQQDRDIPINFSDSPTPPPSDALNLRD